MTNQNAPGLTASRLRGWIRALIPLVALGLMLSVFAFWDPLALFTASVPPIERLTVERVRTTQEGLVVEVVNGGPEAVTISQVLVDEAYWEFEAQPDAALPSLGRATITIPYPWVAGEPHEVTLVTTTGATFQGGVDVATPVPQPGWEEFAAYGLLGVYVGIIPVALGMLWFPTMRQMDRKWMGAILSLTLGLLVFLLVDTLLEALEVAETLPEFLQGISLVVFAALLTWLVLLAVGNSRSEKNRSVYIAALIALGIGLHNLGEGLAIGAAFALGEAALGSFLVIGFTLHNITEGIGIAAPLAQPAATSSQPAAKRPPIRTFLWLALLAGAPAILGAWVGGFFYSPFLTVLFLGIGVGAIWQVIFEVGRLLRQDAERADRSIVTWLNVLGFLAGLAVMYGTAFLVKV